MCAEPFDCLNSTGKLEPWEETLWKRVMNPRWPGRLLQSIVDWLSTYTSGVWIPFFASQLERPPALRGGIRRCCISWLSLVGWTTRPGAMRAPCSTSKLGNVPRRTAMAPLLHDVHAGNNEDIWRRGLITSPWRLFLYRQLPFMLQTKTKVGAPGTNSVLRCLGTFPWCRITGPTWLCTDYAAIQSAISHRRVRCQLLLFDWVLPEWPLATTGANWYQLCILLVQPEQVLSGSSLVYWSRCHGAILMCHCCQDRVTLNTTILEAEDICDELFPEPQVDARRCAAKGRRAQHTRIFLNWYIRYMYVYGIRKICKSRCSSKNNIQDMFPNIFRLKNAVLLQQWTFSTGATVKPSKSRIAQSNLKAALGMVIPGVGDHIYE